MSEGEINDTVVGFVANHSAQPAKNYVLVKSHKPGCKFRVITAGSNSATIHLSAFPEKFLGPLARSQEHVLVDTSDFLNFVNHLNTRYAPMSEEVLLVSWDIEAMYPSIDNKLGSEACRDALNARSEMKNIHRMFIRSHQNNISPRRPKGFEQPPSYFFWIKFLRIKQNQQDFTYSYLDKQQIGKRSKISNTSWK